ncbi:hypothetical protein Nepgr_016806 [Nepenthes gracilis]|uniref:Uncharacterized protein n=1 Tax=Nepenthes gracilis TaxID=150966 RepID=A0AAD3SQD4_NEPGR|nr:hypothetical protein Nepgr_016806 [Nepenthes gracilis]
MSIERKKVKLRLLKVYIMWSICNVLMWKKDSVLRRNRITSCGELLAGQQFPPLVSLHHTQFRYKLRARTPTLGHLLLPARTALAESLIRILRIALATVANVSVCIGNVINTSEVNSGCLDLMKGLQDRRCSANGLQKLESSDSYGIGFAGLYYCKDAADGGQFWRANQD